MLFSKNLVYREIKNMTKFYQTEDGRVPEKNLDDYHYSLREGIEYLMFNMDKLSRSDFYKEFFKIFNYVGEYFTDYPENYHDKFIADYEWFFMNIDKALSERDMKAFYKVWTKQLKVEKHFLAKGSQGIYLFFGKTYDLLTDFAYTLDPSMEVYRVMKAGDAKAFLALGLTLDQQEDELIEFLDLVKDDEYHQKTMVFLKELVTLEPKLAKEFQKTIDLSNEYLEGKEQENE